MPSPKQIVKFFAIMVLLFAGLMWPSRWWQDAYAGGFRAGGNLVFARFWFWSEGHVKFLDPNGIVPGDLPPWAGKKVPDSVGVKDTVMVLENRGARAAMGFLRTSSRYIGYVPTAMMISLVLATPVAWRKRFRALGWSLLVVHLFVILRVSLTLAYGYCGEKDYALFHPGPFWLKMLGYSETVLQEDPTVSFVVPVFVWFVFLFRPSQWNAQPVVSKSGISNPG
ncbi:MAG: hypothetical protein AABZ47_08555 [Planctomycetota bacterium]